MATYEEGTSGLTLHQKHMAAFPWAALGAKPSSAEIHPQCCIVLAEIFYPYSNKTFPEGGFPVHAYILQKENRTQERAGLKVDGGGQR